MRTVVGRLVGESDRVVRNLVEGWEEERRVGRLISDTKQSRFPYLSNSAALPPLFPSLAPAPGATSVPGTQISLSSLANTTSNVASALQSYAPGVRKTATATGPAPTPVPEEEPGPDPRDVNRALGELVALSGRWTLFRRFVHSRLMEDEEDEGDDIDLDVVEQSGSQRAIENMLRTYYEPLELWYLRSSVEKAHRLDLPDVSNKPHLSSILDDTFYLIKVVLTRVLSSGSLSALKTMREKISTVLEKDYAAVLSKKMERVYAAQPATYDRAEKERREKDQKESYIVRLRLAAADTRSSSTTWTCRPTTPSGCCSRRARTSPRPGYRASVRSCLTSSTCSRTWPCISARPAGRDWSSSSARRCDRVSGPSWTSATGTCRTR